MYVKPGDSGEEADGLDNVIEAGDTDEGEGGALPLKAGDSLSGDGGEASLRGGDGGVEGNGGDAIIKGGTGGITGGAGGEASLTGGDALPESDGDGGDTEIDAGEGDGAGSNGDLTIGINAANMYVGTAGFLAEGIYRGCFISPYVEEVEAGIAVALNIEVYRSNLHPGEGSTGTLASGTTRGQAKKIILMEVGEFVITYNGGTTVTLDAVGEFVILMWDGILWQLYDYGTHDPECPEVTLPE
jgi:hypothetical protein